MEKNKSNAFIMNHVIGTHLDSPLNQMREYKLKEQIPCPLDPGYHRHRKIQRLKEDKWKSVNEGVESNTKQSRVGKHKKNFPLEPPYMPKSLVRQSSRMFEQGQTDRPFHPSLFALSLMTPLSRGHCMPQLYRCFHRSTSAIAPRHHGP